MVRLLVALWIVSGVVEAKPQSLSPPGWAPSGAALGVVTLDGEEGSLVLTWTAVPNADRYQVELSRSAAFGELLPIDATASRRLDLPNLGPGRYFARVRAVAAKGQASKPSPIKVLNVVQVHAPSLRAVAGGFEGTAPLKISIEGPIAKITLNGADTRPDFVLKGESLHVLRVVPRDSANGRVFKIAVPPSHDADVLAPLIETGRPAPTGTVNAEPVPALAPPPEAVATEVEDPALAEVMLDPAGPIGLPDLPSAFVEQRGVYDFHAQLDALQGGSSAARLGASARQGLGERFELRASASFGGALTDPHSNASVPFSAALGAKYVVQVHDFFLGGAVDEVFTEGQSLFSVRPVFVLGRVVGPVTLSTSQAVAFGAGIPSYEGAVQAWWQPRREVALTGALEALFPLQSASASGLGLAVGARAHFAPVELGVALHAGLGSGESAWGVLGGTVTLGYRR